MKKISINRLKQLIAMRPDTPVGKSGNIAIEIETIPTGVNIPVVSMRNAIFIGVQPLTVSFTSPLDIHKLVYERGTWMTDHPQELWQMDWAVKRVHGRLLVGGVGLGVCQRLAISLPKIESTLTVELSPDIIKLVAPSAACPVEQADLFKYLADLQPNKFDSALFDIWQSTGEWTWTTQVVPLRRLTRGKIKKVVCWLEEEMHGQVMTALPRSCTVPALDGIPPHYRVFVQACDRLNIKRTICTNHDEFFTIAQENQTNKKLMRLAKVFTEQVGTDHWEKLFGDLWDYTNEQQESAS